MQPFDYTVRGNPQMALYDGMAEGLQRRQTEQGMKISRDANARQQELQPGRIEAQGLNNEAAAVSIQRNREQMAADQAARQRQEGFQRAMGGLADLGTSATPEDFLAVSTEYPEFSRAVNETWGGLSDARKAGVLQRLTQVGIAIQTGNIDLAKKLTEEYAKAAEASGDAESAASARSILSVMDVDPDAALASIGLTLSSIDPQMAEKVFGTSRRVQSSQIIGGDLSVQTMSDGSTRVVDMATNQPITGQAAADAIAAARQSDADLQGERSYQRNSRANEADADTIGPATLIEGLAENQVEFVSNALSSVSTLSGNIRNLMRVRDAIDAGGRAGAVNRLLPDITQASAELRNAMDQLGLDVVGSVTFGALSEGELRLAMDVAVPRNLSGPELREWVVERIDAQEKLRAGIIEQAQFLSDPNNTLQDWTQEIERSDRSQFLQRMQDKRDAGEPFTDAESRRLREIAGR